MNSKGKTPVSVLVTTQNEELNLEDCLQSVIPWADQVMVLDSGSEDRTLEICEQYPIDLYSHGPYEGAAIQRNWALDNLPFQNTWILLLDADERVPPALAKEITGIIDKDGDGKVAYWVNRRFIFYGHWIRYCGWYPSWNIRLFMHGKARHEMRAVGPHLLVDGEAGYLKNDLIHEDLRDLSFWIAKHNRYSNWEAKDHHQRLTGSRKAGFLEKAPAHTKVKRLLKDTIWPRLPGRGILMFFYLFVIRLGFLDGLHGFRFCVMHGIFEHFNVMKQWEMRNYKEGAKSGGISAARYFDPVSAYDLDRV